MRKIDIRYYDLYRWPTLCGLMSQLYPCQQMLLTQVAQGVKGINQWGTDVDHPAIWMRSTMGSRQTCGC
jgi:hypothetical protein